MAGLVDWIFSSGYCYFHLLRNDGGNLLNMVYAMEFKSWLFEYEVFKVLNCRVLL